MRTALAFPTVLFSFALLVVIGFWLLALMGGVSAHGHAGHGGHGEHAGHGGHGGHGEIGSHHDGHGHGGEGLLAAAGLDGVPVTVVLSLLTAVAWFVSLAGSELLDGAGAHGPVRVLLAIVVLAVALVGSWSVTWLLVRPLRRLFPEVRPPSRQDFVGSLCVIRTGRVGTDFGQAEVTAPDGSSAVVQVRQTGEDTFASGSTALLYEYEPAGEFFWVAPFDPIT
ncbi:hypothetical protein ACIGXA_30410 [Streptomyces fildesensis]|uniref:DUF1449 family protein n=1 Tax=Streptomyces fildesensis TaxID=375757 RepID=A0ABW8CGC5_9ACTN